MFWTDGWVERCCGLVVGLRDVWGWWVDKDIFWADGWVERCFGLVSRSGDVLD